MLNKENISNRIRSYIEMNNISLSQIEKSTGIECARIKDSNVNFSASEFLELCSYLNLKPENFMSK